MTRRPKTPRTAAQEGFAMFCEETGRTPVFGYRRQPKGRRAKSGQWAKRTPCPVPLGYAVERTIKAMHNRRMAIEALQRIVAERTSAKTFREVRDNLALYGRAVIHEDDAAADLFPRVQVDGVVTDEAADPIPMDVLQRCEPRMAGGTKIEASTDRSDEPWDM